MLDVFHSQALRRVLGSSGRPCKCSICTQQSKNLLKHSEASLRSLSQHIKMSFTFTPRIGSSREPAARDGVCGALLSDIRLPNSKTTTPDEHVTRRNHEPTKTRNDPNTNRRHLPPSPHPPLNDFWNPVCFKNAQIHGGPYGRETLFFEGTNWVKATRNKKLLRAPGITARNKKLLAAPGHTTRNKKLPGAPGHTTRSKKLLGAPGLTTRSKKLLGAPGLTTWNKKLLGAPGL